MRYLAPLAFMLVTICVPAPAAAHCDTTRGPVVAAARAALDAGDPALVLHWVRPEDESAVTAAFRHALAVRRLGPDAKALADQYFFETVVRIHRAGEGAPYTGLSDRDPEPIIAATDRALRTGSADELEHMLVAAVTSGLAERFAAAREASRFTAGDVPAGRRFVAAYVPLTHWVEGVYAVASEPGEHPSETAGHAAPDAPRHYLPWVLTVVLAGAALLEGAFLIRRQRASAV
jgi:uncharacterized protein DUF6448